LEPFGETDCIVEVTAGNYCCESACESWAHATAGAFTSQGGAPLLTLQVGRSSFFAKSINKTQTGEGNLRNNKAEFQKINAETKHNSKANSQNALGE
jgi:hypothetical protein